MNWYITVNIAVKYVLHNIDVEYVESEKLCGNEPVYFQNSLLQVVDLFKILSKFGASLYTYKDTLNWAYETKLSGYEFDTKQYQND